MTELCIPPREITLHEKTFEQRFSAEQVRGRVDELGAQIAKDYAGRNPLLLGVLKGAFVFTSDLACAMEFGRTEFIQLSSYGMGTKTSGTVRMLSGLKADFSGEDVIIVDEMVDSGLTVKFL